MRWRSNRIGDTRTMRRFAWWPVECHNGVTVWLELYSVTETYGETRAGLAWFPIERAAD